MNTQPTLSSKEGEEKGKKKKKKCKCQSCGVNEGTDYLHSCPYANEINDDDTENCNCCSDCVYECSMDI